MASKWPKGSFNSPVRDFDFDVVKDTFWSTVVIHEETKDFTSHI